MIARFAFRGKLFHMRGDGLDLSEQEGGVVARLDLHLAVPGKECRAAGAELVSDSVISNDAPGDEETEKCRELGAALA